MEFYNIFFDIIENFFDFLIIDLFIIHNGYNAYYKCILRPFFLILRIVYAIVTLPDWTVYVLNIFILAHILYSCKGLLYKRFFIAIKYFIYDYISTFAIILLHAVLFRDLLQMVSNPLYIHYNSTSGIIISYIIACMYFNTKKIKALSSAKSYIFLYYFIAIATIATMSISPVLIEPSVINLEQILPLFFILIAFIITICLTTYSRITITLEENAMNKIQLEKSAMEAEYNTQIDDKLQQLHALRHDMKNHLLVIDSLSSECKNEQIHDYICKISDQLNQTQTISSASSTISALLNSKKLICDDYKIAFNSQLDFNDIYISDFTLITVLGNILDNAITAASKVDNGYIRLSIEQAGTYLSIHCENNHCEKIKKREGRFISSKPSSGSKSNPLHGLGIISVTNTVEKCGGTVNINYSDSEFIVDILIPNYR